MNRFSVVCVLAISLCVAQGVTGSTAADCPDEAGVSSSSISSRVEKTEAGE